MNTPNQITNIIGISIFVLIGILLLLYILHFVLRARRKALKDINALKEASDVSFVVDTFHELVGKLKEKEKELDRLRTIAEERALSMESYNENILQSVPSGVVSLDNSFKIKSINFSAEKILAIKAEEAIGKDYEEIFNEPITGLIKSGAHIARGEYPYITKNGRHIYLGITTSPLKNAKQEVIGRILIFTDLTEMKSLQAQVELKERLSQLGEMSAGIAHELRNPMGVIAGYAKLLSKRSDPSQKTIVNEILREIDGMDKIIMELLAFARPTELNITAINLKDLIEDAAFSTVGGNPAIKLRISGASPSITIRGDEVLLRQALTNILKNAAEAMPDGGGLDIKITSVEGKVEISTRDTGPGIPEEVRKKIFLPFYTTKEDGTGLGLALVQKIIVSHGGSIEVESSERVSDKEGQGTTFRITLPAK
ncbi:MAG: PAS domain-containing protein [Nitrospirae bacterium]|nr:PAS domain-containing protein [Nitrospirota bacterium]